MMEMARAYLWNWIEIEEGLTAPDDERDMKAEN